MNFLTVDTFDAAVLPEDVRALILFAPKWSVSGNQIAVDMESIDPTLTKVFQVDIDESPDLAMRFSIRVSPYLIFFDGGVAKAASKDLSAKMLEFIQV